MKVPPSNSKTSDTVVDVGIPNVLNMSSTMTSVTITARNIVITSSKLNWSGLIIPWRATSIMPVDITAPIPTPIEAMTRTVLNFATLAPMADCRKLTASLLTPTNRSNIARLSKKTTIKR